MIRHFVLFFSGNLFFSTVLKYCEVVRNLHNFPIVFEYYSVSLRETWVNFWCVSLNVRGNFASPKSSSFLAILLFCWFVFF
jgi:hypothetical protein